MQARTKRQKEVLDFITRYIEKHGYEPSYQQIARQLGVASKGGVARHIKSLETQGLLKRIREDGSFRLDLRQTESITEAVCQINWLEVPRTETFVEEWEKQPLYVPRFMLGFQTPDRVQAFCAPNDAMLDQHIVEGDIGLIENRSYARDGDIIVALTQNKRAVLKQYFREGAKVELRPANPNYASILLPADKVTILGVLRGILRPFS